MKKQNICVVCALSLAAMLTPLTSVSLAAPMTPASQVASAPASMYGTYEYIGSDAGSNYYLDPSSCHVSNTNSSIPTLGCMIYKANTNSHSNTPIHQLESYNVSFNTYRGNPDRVIQVTQVLHNEKDVTKEITAGNGDFFRELFWKVANTTGAAAQWQALVEQEAADNKVIAAQKK